MLKREPVILEFETVKITVNPDKLTPWFREQFAEALSVSREKFSNTHKYPMNEGETWEDWSDRIGKGMSADKRIQLELTRRTSGESVAQWISRINRPDTNIHKQGWHLLSSTLPLLGLELHEDDYWKLIPWYLMEEFLFQFVSACDMEALEYLNSKRPQAAPEAEVYSGEDEGM